MLLDCSVETYEYPMKISQNEPQVQIKEHPFPNFVRTSQALQVLQARNRP